MKKISILLIISIVIGILLTISDESYATDSSLIPTASNNIQISLKRNSALVPLNSGYMRVFYDRINNNIGVEYYDDNFNILRKKKIELELSVYGGFYAGSNAYYVVEGQSNKDEDSNLEVIRVIKYDKDWNRLGAARITSDSNDGYKKIRYPFDVGCVEMTEVDGNLYIVTGHTGYIDDSIGQGHQGFLMLEVNESTLIGKIVDADLWHSFAQYIDYKDSNLYVLEQSEGSGRTQLTRYDKTTLKNKTISLLSYGGDRTSVWAQECYASVDGMAIAQNNVLSIGTSIDQSKYDSVSPSMAHNIYLAVTPIDSFSTETTTLKWLTSYADEGQCFTGLEITKINDNRFMISWEEYEESQDMVDNDTLSTSKLHYIFVDGNGNKLGAEYTAAATISDCKPIVKEAKIVYYASNGNMVDFYTIDSTTGKFSKVIYRVAGENATWFLDNKGVLTISGSGKISVDTEARFRYPLSSTASVHSYSSLDNAWKPIRSLVKEIVVKEGITSIPDNEFQSFSNLTQVILPNSMKTIGKLAFKGCSYLRKILMLSNITSIGEDALWSGYYSYSDKKLCFATVYTTKESYVELWAKENEVSYKYVDNLTLTDSTTGIILKVLGETTTNFVVNKLETDNKDYSDMKDKISDKFVLSSYTTSTNNGICFGDNELTFKIGKNYKGKNVSIVQKKSNGDIEVVNKEVDSNGNVTIITDELSSFMIGIDPSDVDYLLGDVNGDGNITLADCTKILAHVKKTKILSEEEQQRADVNVDGKVTLADYTKVLAHVKKTKLLSD